jgi:RNA polymerase sigma factor (sigma-70 family)
MVYAVCQSVLRQRHDAEDAFQAAFLILAQKASSIRQHDGLAGWLQRVAYHVALKARADNARRQRREAKAARFPVAEANCEELTWGELRSILHAELAALPEQFRAPLVLCHLEGRTQEEAARQLGWTMATVKGRLQRGREKLRRRLERRGVALTAALGAALTGQALAETAVRSSGPLTMATATTAAAALAHGFLRPLLPIKLALLSAVLLSIGVVAGGIALRSPPAEPRPLGSDPPKPAAKPPQSPVAIDAHGDPLPDGAVARLGTIRFNHGDGLNALFFSPDGKTIYSEGNGNIRIWDAASGKERGRIDTTKTFTFDDQGVLLADGKTFLSLMQFHKGDLFTTWDLVQKKKIRKAMLPVQRRVLSSDHHNALSSDGKLAALHVDTPAQVQVFEVETGKNLYQLAKGDKEFLAVAFAGTDRLVSADTKQGIDLWEARTGKHLRHFSHKTQIRHLLASPDGRWLAGLEQRPSLDEMAASPGGLYLWDLRGDTVKQSLGAKMWIANICFTPESKSLLALSHNAWSVEEGVLWDCATGRRLLALDKPLGIRAGAMAIRPDGKHLATGGRAGKFELWDLKTGHRLTSEDSRYTLADAVVLSANGDRATIIGQTSLSSWDAATGRRLQAVDQSDNLRFQYVRAHSSDGRYAVSYRLEVGGNNGQPPRPGQAESRQVCILVWDLAERKCLHTLRVPEGRQPIKGVSSVFAADAPLLATRHPGEPTRIRLWDVRGGKLLRSFEEKKGEGEPITMNFTADGKTLFVAGANVTGYEVASGKELFSWLLKRPHNPFAPTISERKYDRIGWGTLAASPDGTVIAATPWPASAVPKSKDDAIVLYDAQTGKIVRRCSDPNIMNYSREHLAFSADGRLLASSNETILHLWEAATGKLIQSFKGHKGSIRALAFSRDGRRLASASGDSTVLIWDVTGQPAKTTALTEAKLNECWNDLAEEAAGRAHRAVWTLIRAPRESVAFLKAHLHPVKSVSREQFDRWIQDLDAESFEVRQKASAELAKLGELAERDLRRALENKPTLEQRRRVEPILAELESKIPSGEALRSLRAVRVLEHAGTTEARQLLRELAAGAENARLTREAKAVLTRISRRSP